MLFRSLLAGLALAVVATASEAGPFRRYARPTAQPTAVVPTGLIAAGPTPTVISPVAYTSGPTPVDQPVTTTPPGTPGATIAPADGSVGDGLGEVNAQRAARGLRPFVRDEGLTQAALACAQHRAAHGLFGHSANDFAFVPAGTFASAAGCAAYPAGYGWMSCCVYENYTYAGAAWVTGRDGRRYMHLFVR